MRYATSPLCLACGYRKEDASLVANARRIYPARDWVELQPSGAKKLRRFSIPRILTEACLINLPVLKTHVVSTMTLGMKNPMGILPRPDRRSMHTLGIDQCIVDMNRAIKPGLTIVDGSVGQDGEGPLYGDKADLQVLVAGRDSLAVDLVCCQLVGVKARDIPHLKLALEQLGKPSWTLSGEEVGVIKKFRLPAQKPLYRFIFWMMYPLDYPFNWIAGRGNQFAVYRGDLAGDGRVNFRHRFHRFNRTERLVFLDLGADLGQLHKYDIAERILREIGDADSGSLAIQLQPLMLPGVFQLFRI